MVIKSHFFGKDCIIDRQLLDRADINDKMEQKGFEFNELLFVNQIHSSEVVVVDDESKVYDYKNLPKADALVTNLKNVAIAVFTADCSPVVFFDEENSIIAVAHAGWKGAKSGILQNTIKAMRDLGAKNISAKVGPMIQQNSYEVSEEFYNDFLVQDSANSQFFKSADKEGHYLFDLPGYVLKQLSEQELVQVENLGIDTYSNEDGYFSYRRSCHRQEDDCGRNVSVVLVG